MQKTLSDLIKDEAEELSSKTGKYPYFSKPYPCAMEECLSYFKNYLVPVNRIEINKTENQTEINIKPIKGSGKRKLYTIKIWVA